MSLTAPRKRPRPTSFQVEDEEGELFYDQREVCHYFGVPHTDFVKFFCLKNGKRQGISEVSSVSGSEENYNLVTLNYRTSEMMAHAPVPGIPLIKASEIEFLFATKARARRRANRRRSQPLDLGPGSSGSGSGSGTMPPEFLGHTLQMELFSGKGRLPPHVCSDSNLNRKKWPWFWCQICVTMVSIFIFVTIYLAI